MKKNLFKVISLLLMMILVVGSITACDANKMPSNPKDIIKLILEKSADIKNMDSVSNMEIEMSTSGLSMTIKSTQDMSVFSEPYKAKIAMTMDMAGLGNLDTEIYLGEVDGKYYTFTNLDGWTAEELDETMFNKAKEQYSSDAGFDVYLSNVDSFKVVGTEEIDGKEVTKLEGTITGQSLKDFIEKTGAMESLDMQEIPANMFDELKDLNVAIWIDNVEKLPVKMSADMSDMMQSIMSNLANSELGSEELAQLGDLTISKCTMEMTYKNINKATDFEIPQEAKDAISK